MPRTIRALLMTVVGIVLFAGLPLCGWGLSDLAGFTADPARRSYLVLVFLLNLIVVATKPRAEELTRRPQKIVARQRLAVGLLQLLSILIVVAGPFCDRRDIAVIQIQVIRYWGLFLFAVGFLGLHWAEVALGKQFSVQVAIQEGHRLVTDGPYRYLRHPRYLP